MSIKDGEPVLDGELLLLDACNSAGVGTRSRPLVLQRHFQQGMKSP